MTVWEILKTNNLHPYHIQLHQEHGGRDLSNRLDFCEWLMNDNRSFHYKILRTDEAIVKSNGDVNSHNAHYWSRANPHCLRKVKNQHAWIHNVWCCILGGQIIGQHLFDNVLNGPVYIDFLKKILCDLLGNVPVETRSSDVAASGRLPISFLNIGPPN